MLGSSQGSSQALSHFISRGAWKQADKDTRRKSEEIGGNRGSQESLACPRPEAKVLRARSAHALPGAARSTSHTSTGPSHGPPPPTLTQKLQRRPPGSGDCALGPQASLAASLEGGQGQRERSSDKDTRLGPPAGPRSALGGPDLPPRRTPGGRQTAAPVAPRGPFPHPGSPPPPGSFCLRPGLGHP